MIRALLVVLQAGLLVAAVLWLSDMAGTGSVDIMWRGWQIQTTPGILVAATLVLCAALMFLSAVWRLVFSLPKRWRKFRRDMAREDGYRALTQGLVAVAAGDAPRAEKMTKRAQDILPEQPLTRLLAAQTALLQGNEAAARRAFADLLDDPEGAFFGVRGMINDSLSRRDYKAARDYLRQADRLQPRRPWILRSLFDMEAKSRDWLAAEKTLRRAQRAGAMDAASAKTARQIVWAAQSLDAAANDHLPRAARRAEGVRFAEAAYRLDVDNTPVVLVLADALIAAGKTGPARRLLRRSWERKPHPQIVPRWQQLLPPPKGKMFRAAQAYDEADARYHWTAELTGTRPEHIESKHALGAAALAARHWRAARPLLTEAADYRALAELEQRETGDEAAARYWLEQAAAAPPRHTWICDSCGTQHETWQPLCPSCDSFNSFSWRRPDDNTARMLAWRRMETLSPTGIAVLNPPL